MLLGPIATQDLFGVRLHFRQKAVSTIGKNCFHRKDRERHFHLRQCGRANSYIPEAEVGCKGVHPTSKISFDNITTSNHSHRSHEGDVIHITVWTLHLLWLHISYWNWWIQLKSEIERPMKRINGHIYGGLVFIRLNRLMVLLLGSH
jgi:hypothetical protein